MDSASTSKRLALAICDFLSRSLADGLVAADEKDSIDIATNLIAESFKVNPADSVAVAAAVSPHSLLDIYAAAMAAAPAATSSSPMSASTPAGPTAEQHAKAEALKSRGNAAVAAKDYDAAVALYSQALELVPQHAVYLSNRAAAYSAARQHDSALADAEAATVADPAYAKGWSRLGLARFALGDVHGARDAYASGISAEATAGAPPSDAMRKGLQTAQRKIIELEALPASSPPTPATPDLAGLASMLGGAGGGGGLDSLSGIMNNPMFASMAQNLMSNPDLMANLMSNPRLREVADQFGRGGGMPDMSGLMSDPRIADIAKMVSGPGAGNKPGPGPGDPLP